MRRRVLMAIMAPALVVALFGTSLYVGLVRDQAVGSWVSDISTSPVARTAIADGLVDQLLDAAGPLVSVLIEANREAVRQQVAEGLNSPDRRMELSKIVDRVVYALLHGEPTVEVDIRPVLQPLFDAINRVVPEIELGQQLLDGIEPIRFGEEADISDLSPIRRGVTQSLIAWPIFLLALIGYIVLRRREAVRGLSIMAVTIGTTVLFFSLLIPRLTGLLVGADSELTTFFVTSLLTHAASFALWGSVLVLLAGLIGMVTDRRRLKSAQIIERPNVP